MYIIYIVKTDMILAGVCRYKKISVNSRFQWWCKLVVDFPSLNDWAKGGGRGLINPQWVVTRQAKLSIVGDGRRVARCYDWFVAAGHTSRGLAIFSPQVFPNSSLHFNRQMRRPFGTKQIEGKRRYHLINVGKQLSASAKHVGVFDGFLKIGQLLL